VAWHLGQCGLIACVQNATTGSLAAVVRVNVTVRSKRSVPRTPELVLDCVQQAGMALLARQVPTDCSQ